MKRLLVYIIAALGIGTTIKTGEDQHPYYLNFECGGSFSRRADIHVNTDVWDPASTVGGGLGVQRCVLKPVFLMNLHDLPQELAFRSCGLGDPCSDPKPDCSLVSPGYAANLGNAPMVGLGFGYYFNEHLSGGFSINHRSNFRYRLFFQSSIVVTTPGFLAPKTRFFDFDNTSFMANLRADYILCHKNHPRLILKPYIGLGIGLSKNTVYNFHSVTTDSVVFGGFPTFTVGSIMNDKTINQFAWQADLGFQIAFKECLLFGIGYRYFNGNKFISNNYSVNVPAPWVGSL